ncbi:hypothetical protein [Halopelagius longus]|uniref:Uncharacterized protein n=1 Tax=Halopelagius longus TaxID=1236180 RepID=A0A1H1E596_9EURY|nr:hypothetical protein [Halopelagius longus]RDI71612.1 hypothetical protein DWB78_07665 [Halopelagius longus]SDQ83877.1 hypothetical protein SAMN05216278_2740 [Halopelagius longus]
MGDESGVRDDWSLPDGLVAELEGLQLHQLREVVHYAQGRIRELQAPLSDKIEAAPGEEILATEERPEYTEVIKSEPCGEECSDCPHGPYLYHVYEEVKPDGRTSLHWVFLGRVFSRHD